MKMFLGCRGAGQVHDVGESSSERNSQFCALRPGEQHNRSPLQASTRPNLLSVHNS